MLVVMDNTILSPIAGQTVVSSTDHHRDQHGHHGSLFDWTLATDKREQTRVHETSRDFAEVQEAICSSQREALRSTGELAAGTAASATATVVGFKDSLAIAYQVEGRALLEAAKNANLLGVQATANFNAVSVQADKNFYALSLEAVKNAAAAELSARTIAAQAAAQAAECCCELKALILAQGETTRSLITADKVEVLRGQITQLQIQNASLFTAKVPPTTPIA